mmetsp:Transcript_107255/g.320792  ORF Transcript_107255/g.320792 Transcript_107255/m.320792 type:complete len:210 (+) Transcript_107255:1637-2266(+)
MDGGHELRRTFSVPDVACRAVLFLSLQLLLSVEHLADTTAFVQHLAARSQHPDVHYVHLGSGNLHPDHGDLVLFGFLRLEAALVLQPQGHLPLRVPSLLLPLSRSPELRLLLLPGLLAQSHGPLLRLGVSQMVEPHASRHVLHSVLHVGGLLEKLLDLHHPQGFRHLAHDAAERVAGPVPLETSASAGVGLVQMVFQFLLLPILTPRGV